MCVCCTCVHDPYTYTGACARTRVYYVGEELVGVLSEPGRLIMPQIPLTRGLFATVDAVDYERLFTHKWYATHGGYAARGDGNGILPMHRVIMGLQKGDKLEVDHIDHNPLNNQRSNLRIVTKSQNQMNRSLGVNNTSGITGIHWDKIRSKWVVQVRHNKTLVYKKRFDSYKDAVAARKAAIQLAYGEYAFGGDTDGRNITS